ncbi:hypothetical protein F4803DRAFT_449217 [Xylaria telfairii]|nr:hypothetical protein F4803DRAFT_449217 [Xylaria telfairii]
MSLPTRCKKTAAPSTSGERGDSPSVTRLTKQSGLEEVTDTRIAISDCIDRDIACIQCIVNIAESPIAASSNVVDKSRNFVVVCDQKAAAYNPGCSRCVALKSFCRKGSDCGSFTDVYHETTTKLTILQVPEVAKAQADTLYANYRQFHNGSCDGSQKQILYSAVHDWLRVAYEHDISEGIQQGLNQVFPSPEQAYEAKDKVIESVRLCLNFAGLDETNHNSIIAIHGLNGTSLSAWVAWKKDGDPSSGDVHWLRDPDMLPSRIPTARIFTYDWNSKYDNSAAEEKLLGHADDLLRSLTMERAQDGINRPILFVASCFGGLLLAKALHRASEVKSRYQDILKLTVGVAFLGTPFQGGHPGAVTAAQMRIAVAMEMGFESSSKLVKYLEAEGNDELDELVQSFCEMVNKPGSKFPIVCFYERHTMDFTAMIRDLSPEAKEHLKQDSKGLLTSERSACLAGHDRIGLPVRHNMLIKYSGPHNRVFKTVSYQLECMVEQAAETLERKSQ